MIKANNPVNLDPAPIRGSVLSSTPVYPSGLRGYTGRALFFWAKPASTIPGRSPLPGILLKRGGFLGVPGASPGLNLITLQHRKNT
jgi:hypothetical protein